eukprot:9972007-Lingulodinium_polyedra.AAC.1
MFGRLVVGSKQSRFLAAARFRGHCRFLLAVVRSTLFRRQTLRSVRGCFLEDVVSAADTATAWGGQILHAL